MDERGFSRAQAMLQRNIDDPDRPTRFHLLDREWDLLDGVFCPSYTPVTAVFSQWIPYPVNGSFLEMGSGSGVTAVMAAVAGCRAVTALDISAAAVANTARNAELHRVDDRVRALRSDMFDALDRTERFDMIFWNSNFVEAPSDYVNPTDLHHAFFDPGYAAHRRYLIDGPGRLNTDGRLLLGFSDLGNWPLLRRICAEANLEIKVLEAVGKSLEIAIEFQLLELAPAR
jgi:release factor glutamine methyltransferase